MDLLFSLPHDLCGVGSDSNGEVIEAPKTKAAVCSSAVEFVVLCIVNALNKCVDCWTWAKSVGAICACCGF